MQLSLTQQTAIEAVQADIGRLQRKLQAILIECGGVPGKQYNLSPTGDLEELTEGPG